MKKRNVKWRMNVDFTDVNKACPKDNFSLPRIDQLVDSTSGYELLSFMDAYSGYNQIRMDSNDEEHTSFMTDQGIYYYKVISFGLKNAEATYQRLANKVFESQIGRNMEVYVDDILVKSQLADDHVHDLGETFQCGIEANPEKRKTILDINPPRTVKEIQIFIGRRGSVPLPNHVRYSAELSARQRAQGRTMTCVLYEEGIDGHGESLPASRKDYTDPHLFGAEAEAILLSTPDHRPNGSTFKVDPIEIGDFRGRWSSGL
ncbi:hypothetical protein Nepgr_021981 [Nepenthes gracilis]|uniref:Reverse transcriptase domain-containing protein n=1 Tax=Nepenthes gracilis TaxID=150966 RepID=A0AAD3SZP6_NEPGR|nr:hypothetical protein Nepgr_021981 [Nepenthes gracilis]